MSSSEPASLTHSPPTADQQSKIAQVALDLFLEHGYDATPMSLIAKGTDLTKAGVYHHFESKEDLLYFVHKRHIDALLLPMIEASAAESDPEKRISKFLGEYALLLTRDPTLRVLINETKRLAPKHNEEIKDAWRRALHLVKEAIVELKNQNRCASSTNPTYSAFAAIGMCSWICNWFDHSRPETGPEVAKTMVDTFLQGLLRQDP